MLPNLFAELLALCFLPRPGEKRSAGSSVKPGQSTSVGTAARGLLETEGLNPNR